MVDAEEHSVEEQCDLWGGPHGALPRRTEEPHYEEGPLRSQQEGRKHHTPRDHKRGAISLEYDGESPLRNDSS